MPPAKEKSALLSIVFLCLYGFFVKENVTFILLLLSGIISYPFPRFITFNILWYKIVVLNQFQFHFDFDLLNICLSY